MFDCGEDTVYTPDTADKCTSIVLAANVDTKERLIASSVQSGAVDIILPRVRLLSLGTELTNVPARKIGYLVPSSNCTNIWSVSAQRCNIQCVIPPRTVVFGATLETTLWLIPIFAAFDLAAVSGTFNVLGSTPEPVHIQTRATASLMHPRLLSTSTHPSHDELDLNSLPKVVCCQVCPSSLDKNATSTGGFVCLGNDTESVLIQAVVASAVPTLSSASVVCLARTVQIAASVLMTIKNGHKDAHIGGLIHHKRDPRGDGDNHKDDSSDRGDASHSTRSRSRRSGSRKSSNGCKTSPTILSISPAQVVLTAEHPEAVVTIQGCHLDRVVAVLINGTVCAPIIDGNNKNLRVRVSCASPFIAPSSSSTSSSSVASSAADPSRRVSTRDLLRLPGPRIWTTRGPHSIDSLHTVDSFGQESSTSGPMLACLSLIDIFGNRSGSGNASFLVVQELPPASSTTSCVCPPPVLTGITPATAAPGTTVVLSGINLTSRTCTTIVRFDQTPATIISATPIAVTVLVPPCSGNGNIVEMVTASLVSNLNCSSTSNAVVFTCSGSTPPSGLTISCASSGPSCPGVTDSIDTSQTITGNQGCVTGTAPQPYTFSIVNNSPADIQIDNFDPTTGTFDLTGLAATTDASITLGVTAADNTMASTTCHIVVTAPPMISCAADASTGCPGIQSLIDVGETVMSQGCVTGGRAPFTYFITNSRPANVQISNFSSTTGTFDMTGLAPTTAGQDAILTVQVVDANGILASTSCPVAVDSAPSISCAPNAGTGCPGVPSSVYVGQTVTGAQGCVTNGVAPFTYALTNNSPLNLAITNFSPTTGEFNVTGLLANPTASVTLQVTDSTDTTASTTCTIAVVAPPILSLSCAPNAGTACPGISSTPVCVNVDTYSGQICATGGLGTLTYAVSTGPGNNRLPAGLAATFDTLTGTIGPGIPTEAGMFTPIFTVTDTLGQTAQAQCTINVVMTDLRAFAYTSPSTVEYQLNTTNGAATPLATFSQPTFTGSEFDPTDSSLQYALANDGTELLRVHADSPYFFIILGHPTLPAGECCLHDLTFNPADASLLYSADINRSTGNAYLYTIVPSSGTATEVSSNNTPYFTVPQDGDSALLNGGLGFNCDAKSPTLYALSSYQNDVTSVVTTIPTVVNYTDGTATSTGLPVDFIDFSSELPNSLVVTSMQCDPCSPAGTTRFFVTVTSVFTSSNYLGVYDPIANTITNLGQTNDTSTVLNALSARTVV